MESVEVDTARFVKVPGRPLEDRQGGAEPLRSRPGSFVIARFLPMCARDATKCSSVEALAWRSPSSKTLRCSHKHRFAIIDRDSIDSLEQRARARDDSRDASNSESVDDAARLLSCRLLEMRRRDCIVSLGRSFSYSLSLDSTRERMTVDARGPCWARQLE